MLESLKLFEDVINSERSRENAVVLIMTMEDLLAEKLKQVDIRMLFPEYRSGSNVAAAKKFIVQKFLEKSKSGKKIQVMFMNTLDKNQVIRCISQVGDVADNTGLFKDTLGEAIWKNNCVKRDVIFM
jgi:hypothetical protein